MCTAREATRRHAAATSEGTAAGKKLTNEYKHVAEDSKVRA